MIANAKARGNNEDYILANIHDYEPKEKYDLIHSMEVLYYLEDPESLKSLIFSRLTLSFTLMTSAAMDKTNIAPASPRTTSASISLLCITISLQRAVIAIMIGKVTGILLVL